MSAQASIAATLAAVDATLDTLEAYAASLSGAQVPALIAAAVNAVLPAWQTDIAAGVGLPALVASQFAAQQPVQLASIPAVVPADQVLFVSNAGSDVAAGTQAAPLRTIERAIDLTLAGGSTEIRLLTDVVIAAPIYARRHDVVFNIVTARFSRITITSHLTAPRAQISWPTYDPDFSAQNSRQRVRSFEVGVGASLRIVGCKIVLIPSIMPNNQDGKHLNSPVRFRPSVVAGLPLVAFVNCEIVAGYPPNQGGGSVIASVHSDYSIGVIGNADTAPFILWWSNNIWTLNYGTANSGVDIPGGIIKAQAQAGEGLSSADKAWMRTNLGTI